MIRLMKRYEFECDRCHDKQLVDSTQTMPPLPSLWTRAENVNEIPVKNSMTTTTPTIVHFCGNCDPKLGDNKKALDPVQP